MLERIVRPTALALLVSIALPGCSMLTARGRQERAYSKYVRKMSHRRDRLQAKMMKSKMRIPASAPSEPKVTTDVNESPQSVSSNEATGESTDTAAVAENSN